MAQFDVIFNLKIKFAVLRSGFLQVCHVILQWRPKMTTSENIDFFGPKI